jgi:glycerol-3-phosphate acyltransferase PlsY
MTAIITVFLLTYLFASVPWGLVIGRVKGIDIRKHGSGNIGATNVTRVLGKNSGRLCFLLDFLKGLLPVLIVIYLGRKGLIETGNCLPQAVAAFGAVCGHVWSVYLKFKGGKGVATSAGALILLAPLPLIISGVLWALVFFPTRYVSLASIVSVLALPMAALFCSWLGLYPLPGAVLLLLSVLALLSIMRHMGNIKRLLNGTENRFSSPQKR